MECLSHCHTTSDLRQTLNHSDTESLSSSESLNRVWRSERDTCKESSSVSRNLFGARTRDSALPISLHSRCPEGPWFYNMFIIASNFLSVLDCTFIILCYMSFTVSRPFFSFSSSTGGSLCTDGEEPAAGISAASAKKTDSNLTQN